MKIVINHGLRLFAKALVAIRDSPIYRWTLAIAIGLTDVGIQHVFSLPSSLQGVTIATLVGFFPALTTLWLVMLWNHSWTGSMSFFWSAVACGAGAWLNAVIQQNIHLIRDLEQSIADHQHLELHLNDLVNKKLAELKDAQALGSHIERSAAVGRLAGGIAHDFNNILQTVMTNTSLILGNPTDSPMVITCAERMRKSASLGANVTAHLLDFPRQDYQTEPVDIAALFDGIDDLLGTLLPANIKLETQAQAGLPLVLVNQPDLKTTLMNLATNARDAMPTGGTLTYAAALQSLQTDNDIDLPAGDYVKIAVRDTGTGIDARTIAHVVEPFFTTKPNGKGTGYGLTLANQFAQRSSGAMQIRSEIGQFTEVSFFLPLASQRVADNSATVSDEICAVNETDIEILLVEDDELVRETMVAALRQNGFATTAMSSGEDALAFVAEPANQISLMITDFSLAGISGIDVVKQTRQVRPNLPALLITGYIGEMVADSEGLSFDMLRKPVSPSQLHATIIDLIRADRLRVKDPQAD